MIDHVGLNVSDLAAAKAFYAETLEPLGYRVWAEWEEESVGFAADESGPDFWIYRRGEEPSAPTHFSSAPATGRLSTRSTRRAWPPAGRTTEHPACALTTTSSTTGRSCSTTTATTSKPSATRRAS